MLPWMRAVTVPGGSTTLSSSVSTARSAVASPPSKRTVVGAEPPRVEPVAVTSTDTVRGAESGRLWLTVRESVNVASCPSDTFRHPLQW